MTVTDSDQPDTLGPYSAQAATYWRAGWRGVLPLPAGEKGNPPKGFTGAAGVFPSWPDVQAWLDDPATAAGNVGLRLPQHVLGIDVDAYGDKPGRATIDAAVGRWGGLPATWSSSSRVDDWSGIYLFRVPEGLAWPGEVGPGVELIQHRHRYVVAPPSIHPEGRAYRWRDPAGSRAVDVELPPVEALPLLPDRWVLGLTAGALAHDVARNNLGTAAAGGWLIARDPAGPGGQSCSRMLHALGAAVGDVAAPGSTHEAARAAVLRLTRLAAEGHRGGTGALARLRQAFLADVTAAGRSGRRGPDQAEHEWTTLVAGAVNLVSADPEVAADPRTLLDPCDNPFAGVASPRPAAPASAPLTLPPAHSSPLHTALHTDRPALHLVDDEDPGDLRNLVAGGLLSIDNTAGQAPPAAPGVDQLPPPRERTSWWAVDLAGVLDGRDDDPTATPAYLARLDGVRLVYPGRTNGLLGESESGKTWVGLEAIRQAIAGGERATMLDFEDTAAGTLARLRSLGCTRDQLVDLFTYVSPDEALHAAAGQDLAELLAERAPGLILLDGVNAAMTLFGLEIESNGDATRFATTFLDRLAAGGAAVLTIDHLPKSRENRGKGGIGAQAKRAMMRGAAITVDVITPAAPGKTGKLQLTVDKDRPGKVRGASLGGRNVGTCVIASDLETGTVTVSIEAPAAAPTNADGAFRPTVLMERVSAFLAATPGEWVSRKRIQDGVGGNSKAVVAATDRLREEGYLERKPGPNGATLHRHVAGADKFRADVVDLETLDARGAQPAPVQQAIAAYWDQVTDGDDEHDDDGERNR